MTADAFPPTPRRTWFTNLAGAAFVLLGGIGSVFSAFALLMAIGKPYANSTSDPLGIFLMFILPPGTLLAGIGLLLLRHRWARWWMILLMAGLVTLGVKDLFTPVHANPTAGAAKRIVLIQSVALITVGSLVLLGFFSRPVRREFAVMRATAAPASLPNQAAGWRVGHQGRDLVLKRR